MARRAGAGWQSPGAPGGAVRRAAARRRDAGRRRVVGGPVWVCRGRAGDGTRRERRRASGRGAVEAELAAVPAPLRPVAELLRARLPGASGALAARLERYLPQFLRRIVAGNRPASAAVEAGLPAALGDELLAALAPAAGRADRFVPAGMVETALRRAGRPSQTQDRPTSGTPQTAAGTLGSPALAGTPYAPELSVLVDRAREAGVLTGSLSGLAPAALLDLLSGRAERGTLPGTVLSLLRDVRGGAASAMSSSRVAAAIRALVEEEGLASPHTSAPARRDASGLGRLPAAVRGALLQALVSGSAAPAALRAALAAAGLPVDPAAAVAALLRAEAPAETAGRVVDGYLRTAGVGALTAPDGTGARAVPGWPATPARGSTGFEPTDEPSIQRRAGRGVSAAAATAGPRRAAAPATSATPQRPRAGRFGPVDGGTSGQRVGGAWLGLAAATPSGSGLQGLDVALSGPDLVRALADRVAWVDAVESAEAFEPVVGGRSRDLKPAGGVGTGELAAPEAAAARPSAWPATAEAAVPGSPGGRRGVAAERVPAGPGAETPADVAAATGAGAGLLVPPALRALLGGRSLPEPVLRQLLGMEAGGGAPADLETLVDLLAPAAAPGGARQTEEARASRAAPGLPAPAKKALETLASRVGEALAAHAQRRAQAAGLTLGGSSSERGRSLRLSLSPLDLVRLGQRVEPALVRRLVESLGPEALATLSHGASTVLGGDGPDAAGVGELVGADHRRARALTRAVQRQQAARRERAEERVRAREEAAHEAEQEAAQATEERRTQVQHLAERTMTLARALFPKSMRHVPDAQRRGPFPASLPGRESIDLMLVAPAVEVVRQEASPLLKEIEPADEARAGASQSGMKQRGDDPARIEKFLSPEKIEEFAKRTYDLLVEEISVDGERHGIDPYGYDDGPPSR